MDDRYDLALADVFGGVTGPGYDPFEAYAGDTLPADIDRPVEYDEDEDRR